MSVEFICTLILSIIAACAAIFAKLEQRKNTDRLTVGEELTADDFTIIED